jgi:hypothetical protein
MNINDEKFGYRFNSGWLCVGYKLTCGYAASKTLSFMVNLYKLYMKTNAENNRPNYDHSVKFYRADNKIITKIYSLKEAERILKLNEL